jgi:hypothetical protein
MTIYQCDCCGRLCSRIHRLQAYGMDCSACDDCAGYEWQAYDEDADPLLHLEAFVTPGQQPSGQ